MIADNFTKTLKKIEFKNHWARWGMILTKEDIIAEIESWWAIS